MPVLSAHRPTAPLDWFGSARGLPLLAAERDRIAELLVARAPQPWLWLTPFATAAAADLPPRGLRLHRQAAGLSGAFRCGLPLPLPSESFGVIVVQHAFDDGCLPDLPEEVERILQPGGRLWLFALNPYSPWRLRWRSAGLVARTPAAWRQRLRAAGLHAEPNETEWLGPAWSGRGAKHAIGWLRAGCLIGAEKRVAPLTPIRVASKWRTDAAPAGF
ncbi:MAG: hypothetical protein QM761_08815 [Pseudoxanthomonas sp.]